MLITTQTVEQLATTYKSFSMSSRVIFLTYPGLLTDELKTFFKNNFLAITKAKYRQESDILALRPSDFPELFIKDKDELEQDNGLYEYIIKDYFNTYAKAVEMSLLASSGKINIVEWVPGLHERIYKDNYKDNKIIQVLPERNQKVPFMRYLLDNKDYKTLNMISDTYEDWLRDMQREGEIRLHQFQEDYETLTITVGKNNESKDKISSSI
jgi:hypothetical protein|nr:MAG TPA: hypothetical protein [Caudoviricetes sp.]